MTAKKKAPVSAGAKHSPKSQYKNRANLQSQQGQDGVILTSEAIHQGAQDILELSRHALPGSWASCLVCPWPLVSFDCDFDGAGGILVNRSSLDSATGRAIHAELLRIAPERVSIGQWTGGAA